MLVLSRKKNEGVVIKGVDGEIRIVVIEMDRTRVRLGISAPKGYLILREELIGEVKESNIMAAIADPERVRELIEGKQKDEKA
ncbi:MAG: carbon storage regulator [Nitrososphaerales archaeon]